MESSRPLHGPHASHASQSTQPLAYCARCARQVVAVRAWPGFVWAKRVWYGGIVAIVCLAPIIMSEITLLLPLAMMFGLAAGPVHQLAAQSATCSDCGGQVK